MPDMLVRLYELPDVAAGIANLGAAGVHIRRALPPEKHVVVDFVRRTFSPAWGSECDVSFCNKPASCFVAIEKEKLIGFACYDATCRDFLGPMGVVESERGRGVGKALLLSSLYAMREQGYAYAIIGGAGSGSAEFYAKMTGAVIIEGSERGIYQGMMRSE